MSEPEVKSLIIPDIDKIYEEGREPTEEEWELWAKNFKPKKLKPKHIPKELQLKKTNGIKKLKDKINKKKAYQTKEKYKSWGDKYNTKRKYLFLHNKEWRENLQQTQEEYKFRVYLNKYESWRGLYIRRYKYKLGDYAATFRISENVYVYGFTEKQLQEISPFAITTFKKYKEENLWPLPKYEGYQFKKKSISKNPEKFYLLSEAKVFLDLISTNKKKMGSFNTEFGRLFMKKKFWTAMEKAREEFNEQ